MKHGPSTCHPPKPNYGKGLCPQCYYQANKEKHREARKKWYLRNRADHIRRAGEWRRANPAKRAAQKVTYWAKRGGPEAEARYLRNAHYVRKYGLTYEAVEALIAFQKNRCRICAETLGEIKSGVGPQVDHDHATNQIRGVVCHHCNKMLGHAKDNPQVLANAAYYLMAC